LSDMFPIFSSVVWTWIVAPLVVLICLIRRFKWLAPFGLVGYIAIMFGLGVVMEYCFKDQLLNGQTQITWDRVNHMDYKTLPIFFGIAVYIFEGIGLVIDMEKAMTKPEYFQKCLHSSYVLLLITFIFVGAVGYLTFGTETKDVIILNLPDGPLKLTIIWLIILALYTSYPVQMFPVFAIMENFFFDPKTKWLETKRSILRTLTVIITILLAIGIPHFGLFMSLIGAFGSSLLAFILPTIFHIKLFWGKHHPLRLTINIIIIIFGVIASGISTTVTVIQIVEVMTGNSSSSS